MWVFVIENGGGDRRSQRRRVFVIDSGSKDHMNVDLDDDLC
jgi:hypothetical protein